MSRQNLYRRTIGLVLLLLLLSGCGVAQATSTAAPVTATPLPDTAGLSEAEIATLHSLQRVDAYPLYTMRYHGTYETAARPVEHVQTSAPAWGCSLFATLADPGAGLFGRNFDWQYSPAVLLFADPPDGYASVSMVDIAYLGFQGERAKTIAELPLSERRALLDAPFLPFDGMNERGLIVGMAAVPPGNVALDPAKETVGSVEVIREMLDHARDVDEAVAVLQSYNVDFEGGPPLHYLIADRTGQAVLAELYQGQVVLFPNEGPWHQATNFLRAEAGDSPANRCWRYDRIHQRLSEAEGQLTVAEAMALLADVAQGSTQWSVVYEIEDGQVHVAMGRGYKDVHTFRLGLADE